MPDTTPSPNRRPTVLVSAAALAAPAVAMLEQAGYAVITTTGYPGQAELVAALTEHRPVALLHRQGFIDGTVLDAGAPELRMVARHGAGMDGIDIAAAAARDLTVTRAAGANSRAVAEHTWALLLALAKDLPSIASGMAAGLWEKTSRHTRDLEGRTIGIVGYGAIGSKVARYAEAFGMTVLAYDPLLKSDALPGPGTRVASLAELLPQVSILSLHCPLDDVTRGMIDAAMLKLLPAGALVVNAARGGIVNETDLLASLEAGHVAGAAIDVFETEPLPDANPLRRHPHVIATPHIAANTPNGAAAMATGAADCIISVLAGRKPKLEGAIVSLGGKTPISAAVTA